MHLSRRCVAVVALFALAACSRSPSSPGDPAPTLITTLPRALSPGEQTLVIANNRFASRLMTAVSRSAPDSNIFLSPLSASMALGMAMNGTSGTTFDEMRSTLGFAFESREDIIRAYRDLITLLTGLDRRVDFEIANSVWYRTSFGSAIEPRYLTEARQYFDATVQGLAFEDPSAVTTINSWVKEKTAGKIEKIIETIDPNEMLFLINAIYFKGDWRDGFDRTKTVTAPFTTASGRTVQAPLMTRSGPMRGAELNGRRIVDLGYGGDAFSMSIMLPREDERVDALIESLTPEAWSAAFAALGTREVNLFLPRFKLEWERVLNDDLREMGMPTAFRPREADFSLLSSQYGRELYISFVKQKSYVDVNEVGTEAAAVTAVGVAVTSAPVPMVFRADRPFVFVIRERLSGTILFMGKITDPT